MTLRIYSFHTVITIGTAFLMSGLASGLAPAYAEGLNPASVATIEKNKKPSVLTVSYENDLIGSGSDQYYTSGVQLDYFKVDQKAPDLVNRLADDVLGYDVRSATATSFVLGQKIYTPKSIKISGAQNNDRPWAGWLYTGYTLTNLYNTHSDEFTMLAGIVGPASLAEHTQKFIHKNITDSPKPMGWDNQIHTEPGVVLAWERRWPHYVDGEILGGMWQLEPSVSASLGNVATYGGAGITVTFGPNQKELQDTPPRIFPAMPGSGYFDLPANRSWDWYAFAGLNGRGVVRDIFLDGNSFRDSASIDKRPFVADANAGVSLTYADYRLSYTMVYRTKEFYGQDDPAIFGSLSLSKRF